MPPGPPPPPAFAATVVGGSYKRHFRHRPRLSLVNAREETTASAANVPHARSSIWPAIETNLAKSHLRDF